MKAAAAFGAVKLPLLVSVAAEIEHILACIKGGLWALLIAGCLFPQVGFVHGIGLWFGAF